MTILYGIKNCDTIKKARRWLDQQQIDYEFFDYRADGLTLSLLERFELACGWQHLLNTRGTTFRNLPVEKKSALDKVNALALMLEQPAMIKRPLLQHEDQFYLGFDVQQYQRIFGVKPDATQ